MSGLQEHSDGSLPPDLPPDSAHALTERLLAANLADIFGPEAACMGVSCADSFGAITIQDGWATIGSLIATDAGDLTIMPRCDATDTRYHIRQLAAAVTRAWLDGPSPREWTPVPGVGWMSAVQVRYPDDWLPVEDRRFASAIAAGSVSGDNRICSGSIVPSSR